jgi:hypothetical protein
VIGAWLAFPLLLVALAAGCGLALERATGARLPGALVAPAGLAVLVVEAHLCTLADATAELATPLVVATAAAGAALARRGRRPLRPDPSALAAAALVFAVFALPVVASGEATFAGYVKLDDTATWLAIADRAMEHGRSTEGLAPSTHEAAFSLNVSGGYPIGAFLPLGAGAVLLPVDAAWLFQPYLCVLAAMLALALYELARPLVPRRPARAAAAFVAAQPALLVGYSLWGGVKEVAAAALVATFVALLAWALADLRPARAVAPAAAAAALIAVLSFGGVVWLALPLAVAGAAAVRRRALATAAAFAAATAAFALPSLVTAEVFLRPAAGVVTDSAELGNLIEPLSVLQMLGVWPSGDFRVHPDARVATSLLLAVVAGAAAWGLAAGVRRAAWGLVTYSGATAAAALGVAAFGSPWIDGKAFATAAPAALLPAAAGIAAALGGSHGPPAPAPGGSPPPAAPLPPGLRRLAAGLAALAVAGGVLWSNALAYRDVSLAPRDRLAELERIGERIDGEGPTLMTEYEPYGVRHFLRDADPEGASELRRRVVPLRGGGHLDKGQFADLDSFALDGLLVYRTLVLRRSPAASRPPSVYRRVFRGRWYEAWQRPAGGGRRIVEHLPLGTETDPVGRPACGEVRRLARLAGPGGTLAAATRFEPTVVELGALAPPSWATDAANRSVTQPLRDGRLRATVRTAAATTEVWLGGSVRRTLTVTLDGRRIARVRHQLNPTGQYIPLGRVRPGAGTHRIELRVHGSGLRPGGGGPPPPIGPLVLALAAGDGPPPVLEVPAERAADLCAGGLDWVEALAR